MNAHQPMKLIGLLTLALGCNTPMKTISLAVLLMYFGSHIQPAQSQVIEIRVSYKVVLDSRTGFTPTDFSNGRIDTIISNMNLRLAEYQRGYRFRRVDPIARVGHRDEPAGPSQWFNVNFVTDSGAKDRMEAAATADASSKQAYAWNDSAINIYIVNGICGGACSLPHAGDNIIVMGSCINANSLVHLHEIGHYFGLYHTQGDICGCAVPGKSGTCHTEPGDDEVSDTLPDLSSWDQDDIAAWSFNGRTHSQLNTAEQKQVDDTFFNNMSYHGSDCGQEIRPDRMTEGQLDRWTDSANGTRFPVIGNRTWFVDSNNSCNSPAGGSSCTVFNFGGPFRHVADAVAPAASGDTLLIRPGSYNEQFTITKSLTLRASRAGAVTIGR